MTRDELRRKIAMTFIDGIMDATHKEPQDYQIWAIQYTDQILALIKEAGYLPPEYGKVVLDGIDGAIELLKEKGWKSPEEVEKIKVEDWWRSKHEGL
jgi:hypothetical protein